MGILDKLMSKDMGLTQSEREDLAITASQLKEQLNAKYNAQITKVKPKDGVDGKDGKDGKNGKDGRNGRDGRDGLNGLQGPRGEPGRNGIDGVDGVSVTDAHIDFDGSLIIDLSTGRSINVGEVVSQDLEERIKIVTSGGAGSGGGGSGTVTSVAATAGTGISVTGSPITTSGTLNITNTAPDQVVALTSGTGISATGTYPNFTIANTAPDQTVALTQGGTTTITGTYPNFTISSADQYQGTVTSVTATSPVASTGGAAPAISLSSGYGDTLNPYASKSANFVLAAPNGSAGVPTFRAVVAADIPTLNQNTTGTASNVTGTVAFANGGTGETTRQAAMDALAGSTTSGQYLRGNGTDVVMSAIQAADVPTLNQNTTGNAATATLATNVLNSFGMKNRIINGAMVIDQRNAGAAVSDSGYAVDRWNSTNNTDGSFTFEQVEDAPEGFYQSLKFTVATVDSSLSATQYARVRQIIEANNVSDLNLGTANAKTFTVSFWVKSSSTGTFSCSILNNAYNYSYPVSYTINAVNTWEYKTITITGPTAGTWLTGTNGGLVLEFVLAAASNISGTSGVWAAARYEGVTGAINLMATLSATWQVTGVQLEKGSTATSFDYRPYGTELALCQRYYWRKNELTGRWFPATQRSTTQSEIQVQFPVQLRADPTLGYSGTWNVGFWGSGTTVSSFTFNINGTQVIDVQANHSSGGSAGRAIEIYANSGLGNYMDFSSEL